MLDIIPGPDFIDPRTAPFHPIVKGQVRRILDAVFLLQRRADDTAAATRNDARTTKLGGLLERNRACAGIARLDSACHAGAARTDYRDVRLEFFYLGHC